jgi:hypothetical protein
MDKVQKPSDSGVLYSIVRTPQFLVVSFSYLEFWTTEKV